MRLKHEETGRMLEAEYVPVKGVHNLIIRDYDNSRVLGRAILLDTGNKENAPLLLDIYVYEESDRRKGIASALLELACNMFDTIVTGESTRRGKLLCKKYGFVSAVEGDLKFLIYKRDKGDESLHDNGGERG